MSTFFKRNLRRRFDKYAVARTEHDALAKSMTKIFSTLVAFSENPNFTKKTFFFYFRNERENALLSVIEETRHDTFESAERQHWDAVSSEWEADKMRILTALSGANASEAATESFLPRKEQTRIHETTLGNLCRNSGNFPQFVWVKKVKDCALKKLLKQI